MAENNNEQYSVNLDGIINEIKNMTINNMVLMAINDEEQNKNVKKFLRAFNKRGVSSEIVMSAMLEIAKEE
jgi:hypothetical protein